jgi:hypothetical protein
MILTRRNRRRPRSGSVFSGGFSVSPPTAQTTEAQTAEANQTANASSGVSSGLGASHSLPHLRHFRKSPRALVNFISAPT